MRKTSLYIFILLLIPVWATSESPVEISHFQYGNYITDEWKYPGTYAPFNAFDNNDKTCFAIKKGDNMKIGISFKKPIVLDSILISPGLLSNKRLFNSNHRIKLFEVTFHKLSGNKYGSYTIIESKTYSLRDVPVLQKIALLYPIETSWIQFEIIDVYPSDKYDDVCISTIKFFKGQQEIQYSNFSNARQKYFASLREYFNFILKQKKLYFTENDNNRYIFKNSPNQNMKIIHFKNKQLFLKSKWKFENHKLYFLGRNKWELIKYQRNNDIEVYLESKALNLKGVLHVDIHEHQTIK